MHYLIKINKLIISMHTMLKKSWKGKSQWKELDPLWAEMEFMRKKGS